MSVGIGQHVAIIYLCRLLFENWRYEVGCWKTLQP